MARPRLLSALFNQDVTQVRLEFSEDMVDDGWDPTTLHIQHPNGDFYVGQAVDDVSDETVTVDVENAGGPGFTSISGGTTCLHTNGLNAQDDGAQAYPFVNRQAFPVPLSVEYIVDATRISVVWPYAMTYTGPGSNIKVNHPVGGEKEADGIDTGDGTDTWSLSAVATMGGPTVGRWALAGPIGINGDNTMNAAAAGTLLG